ncbi:hypothetical protein OR1_00259 [Geobacter sp. OR-1]|uniref:hypothetical protein n=1 Tax=Geobacter sp. OR-1 TaxID=1266765 RepID=UPI0005443312|nr:hypothetical protein [Geobacter sp. OR-1]GAM07989.1 hypothetical protein OR1_00259 [Geobacter sp. OR-1]
MVTIIIISNDPHVMHLKERFQPLIKGQICIFSDFEQGLMAVFDKRPASVFIQREINGTAAEVIARQIKGLLRDGSPRIILMGAIAGSPQERPKCFDDSFDFAATEEELSSFFGAQLEKIPHLLWKDGMGAAEWVAATAEHEMPDQELSLVTVSDSSLLTDPFSLSQTDNRSDLGHVSQLNARTEAATGQTAVPPPAVVPQAPPGVGHGRVQPPPAQVKKTPPAGRSAESVRKPEPAQKPPKRAAATVTAVRPEEVAVPTRAAKEDFSSFGVRGVSFGRQVNWIYLAGFVVAAVLGGVLYFSGSIPAGRWLTGGKPAPVKPQSPAKQASAPAIPLQHQRTTVRQVRPASLPQMIPVNGKDPQYSAGHPGWERFSSKGYDFLVFRSNNEIKAVQVVASRDNVITPAMIAELLQQLCGSSAYTSTGTTGKNGYILEQAGLPGGGELVIYRKKPDPRVRGVVITVP